MQTRRRLLAASLAALPAAALGQDNFASFVAGMKAEARRAGIGDATLAAAFAGVQPNQRVIELDHRQPEFTMTWPEYQARVLPPARLQAGRQNYAAERGLLAQVQARYGVSPGIVMGIWGIESGFGQNQGNYRVVEALSTLAWEGRRAAYFRGELLNALRILDAGDVTPAHALSGYAGALGQPQFMPSSFLRYAVDFDGNGRRDIWTSRPDVFGSIANYLARNGWQPGAPWGQPAQVSPGAAALAGRDGRRPLAEWMRLGVRRADGSAFARGDVVGALVVPDGIAPGEGYMTYANFGAIRRYNPSDFYALAVGLLGDACV
jgi:membrane-bound lytic murein transglycosylase B